MNTLASFTATDTLWMLVCACFVFFMQAGFTCYEAGLVQSKNVISVAIENIFNLTISIVLFSLVGFPMMFGETIFSADSSAETAFVFLQIMFAAVSVTIFAGALSERTKLAPLLVAGAVSAALIYPLFGRLAWGSHLSGNASWLEKLGFLDFAGASVVHMTAGFVALAGLLAVGSRSRQHTGKSNIPLAVLGVFILWFGWFGFNGGCIRPGDPALSKVFLNTCMGAAYGTLGALCSNLLLKRNGGYLISLFNGVLSGLVSITALSAYCSFWAAMIVGFIAGILADLSSVILEKLRIDDVVNVIPVHLIGGLTGILTLPFCIPVSALPTDSRLEQFGVQIIGACICFAASFGISFIVFLLMKHTTGLRVTKEEEEKGLNIVEFSDIYSWQNYIETSSYEQEIQEKNDLLRKQTRLLAVTEEQEKKRLAKDLHDGVGQSLSALKVILGMGKMQAKKSENPSLQKTAEKAADLADLSLKEMRNVLNNLKPEALEKGGLKAGLSAMTENLDQIDDFTCRLNLIDPLPDFDETVELNLYRLVQESLTNVVKHAQAKEAVVTGQSSQRIGFYTIRIKDDGIGFNPESEQLGVGIPSMNDRVKMLGGTFHLYSMEGKGTEIIMEVPHHGRNQ